AAAVVAEIEADGGRASASADDVTTYAGADALIEGAVATFGSLEILVNNAGVLADAMSFSMDEDDWDAVVTVHLKGHFAPSRAAGRYWRARAKAGEATTGRIINTVSES